MFLFKIVNKILWPPYPTLTGSVTFCNDFLPLILHLRVSLPSQIQSNLPNNSLYEHFQSGFHSPHNAKTALLRVVNDLLHSADSGSINSLILLDFTAAFDTVNHTILLSHLRSQLGICETAFVWFTSYLTNRQHFISIGKFTSDSVTVSLGVPQGSILSPFVFTIYMLKHGSVIRHHGLHFHFCADDIQI